VNSFAGILAQTSQAAGGDSPGAAQIHSVWDFVVKGGMMMIPIAAASLLAMTVFVERLISLKRGSIIPAGFLPALRERLKGRGDHVGAALEYCEKDNSPLARVIETGLRRMDEPLDVLERHVQETGERQAFKLRKHLRALSLIAAIAPLMGLLGTIFGMIDAFQTVAASGDALGRTELLAKGIYEAMITTAAGLIVAIPSLIAYHWISARIEGRVAEMDEITCTFIEEFVVKTRAARRNGVRSVSASEVPSAPPGSFGDDASSAGEPASAASAK
jgi:biopolymer transport protein ExbB